MRTLLTAGGDSPGGPAGPGEADLDAAYAVPEPPAGGWHVRANFVESADGAAEVGGRTEPLAGPADRRVFRLLRWLSDVVLVGAGTVRAERYGPVRVPADRQERRTAAGLAPVPPLAVVSGRLDLDYSARLFTEAEVPTIVLTCAAAPAERRAAAARVAEIVMCGEEHVDLPQALAELARRGLPRVLCEGGPALFTQLAGEGLVDELCLTLAPLLAGPVRLGMTGGEPWQATRRLRLDHVLEEDGSLFLRYAGAPRHQAR
jgi:riboflavin biosynthesis pyrimidine reductase